MKSTVLITGAGGGIGRATAKRFSAEGWRVLLTDISETALLETAKVINSTNYVALDLTAKGSAKQLMGWSFEKAGHLNALVNAAGIWREGPTEFCAEIDFDEVMNINFKALYFVTSAAVPILRKSEGTIINVASDAGLQGTAGAALYCASKAAVILFSKALALELAPDGIRVNAICPGDVASSMLEFQAKTYAAQNPQAYLDHLLAGYPQGKSRARFITPEEVAGFIYYLCQPEAAAITGAALSMDFGYSAGKF